MLERALRAGAVLVVLLGLGGCGERKEPLIDGLPSAPAPATWTASPSPTATPTATATPNPTANPTATPNPTAGAPPPAAAPAPPEPPPPTALVILRTAIALEPAGRTPLASEAETVVDPASTFELELGAPVADARLQLLDPRDAHVAAAASREVGATTRISLAPAEPLVPGTRYLLRLDGAATRELHDAAGKSYLPVSFPLVAAGTPPAPEPRKPSRRRR